LIFFCLPYLSWVSHIHSTSSLWDNGFGSTLYLFLEQWFPTGGNFAPMGAFGTVWRDLGCQLWGGNATDIEVIEFVDTGTHPVTQDSCHYTCYPA
jgi:hypothetical protein